MYGGVYRWLWGVVAKIRKRWSRLFMARVHWQCFCVLVRAAAEKREGHVCWSMHLMREVREKLAVVTVG